MSDPDEVRDESMARFGHINNTMQKTSKNIDTFVNKIQDAMAAVRRSEDVGKAMIEADKKWRMNMSLFATGLYTDMLSLIHEDSMIPSDFSRPIDILRCISTAYGIQIDGEMMERGLCNACLRLNDVIGDINEVYITFEETGEVEVVVCVEIVHNLLTIIGDLKPNAVTVANWCNKKTTKWMMVESAAVAAETAASRSRTGGDGSSGSGGRPSDDAGSSMRYMCARGNVVEYNEEDKIVTFRGVAYQIPDDRNDEPIFNTKTTVVAYESCLSIRFYRGSSLNWVICKEIVNERGGRFSTGSCGDKKILAHIASDGGDDGGPTYKTRHGEIWKRKVDALSGVGSGKYMSKDGKTPAACGCGGGGAACRGVSSKRRKTGDGGAGGGDESSSVAEDSLVEDSDSEDGDV
jgi:hypothetical protein